MIRNYCTTVLLIWFQGGFFDALLHSFDLWSLQDWSVWWGSTDFTHLLLLHQSTRGSSTVKHCIKSSPPLGSISVSSSKFTFHPHCFTQICQFGVIGERVILHSLGVVGCKDSQRLTDSISHLTFMLFKKIKKNKMYSLWICTTERERDLRGNKRMKSSGVRGCAFSARQVIGTSKKYCLTSCETFVMIQVYVYSMCVCVCVCLNMSQPGKKSVKKRPLKHHKTLVKFNLGQKNYLKHRDTPFIINKCWGLLGDSLMGRSVNFKSPVNFPQRTKTSTEKKQKPQNQRKKAPSNKTFLNLVYVQWVLVHVSVWICPVLNNSKASTCGGLISRPHL